MPGESSVVENDGKEGSVMDVDVMDTTIGPPKNNGATPQLGSTLPSQPGATAVAGQNASSEAFALMPIDVPTVVAESRRSDFSVTNKTALLLCRGKMDIFDPAQMIVFCHSFTYQFNH